MKPLSECITEAMNVFDNEFTVEDIRRILSEKGIKKYEIENDEDVITIILDKKEVNSFVDLISVISMEIGVRKLNLKLYVTGDLTKSKPEIYINKY